MGLPFARRRKTRTGTLHPTTCNCALGRPAVAAVALLTIWLTCLVFAMLERAILPEQREHTVPRLTLWFATANAIFLGAAVVFRWFAGVPLWGGILLVVMMELGLGLMLFGDQFVLKLDSIELTNQLRQYQQRTRQH